MISKRLRFEILRRDNHACRYCGRAAPEVSLTIDHVVPAALGGTDDAPNLVTACADCNAGKSSATPDHQIVQDIDQDAMRWADALRRAAEIKHRQRDQREDLHTEFYDHWTHMNPSWAHPPNGWETTFDNLTATGLTMADLKANADTAVTAYGVTQRNRWRYFCGICWRQVHDLQHTATQLLAAAQPPTRLGFGE